jgi:hypothetical protein
VRTVLRLRSKYVAGGRELADAQKYIDESAVKAALAS